MALPTASWPNSAIDAACTAPKYPQPITEIRIRMTLAMPGWRTMRPASQSSHESAEVGGGYGSPGSVLLTRCEARFFRGEGEHGASDRCPQGLCVGIAISHPSAGWQRARRQSDG